MSCDSLCVYRGMDIGTAKPTRTEQSIVPHFGIDLVDANEAYSVARYVSYRDDILRHLAEKNQPVIVVGGSGFYLKSFFYPVTDELEIPDRLRARVEQVRKEAGLVGLVDWLRSCNPSDEVFEGLDLNNPRRVEKSLLRCLSTGRSHTSLQNEFRSLPTPLNAYEKEVTLISRPAEELRLRNRLRVTRMLDAGLVEEVKELRRAGFERNPSASAAIGYREVLEYLDGTVAENELVELIYTHTNQLMRKQRTWFRHQIPVDREVIPD